MITFYILDTISQTINYIEDVHVTIIMAYKWIRFCATIYLYSQVKNTQKNCISQNLSGRKYRMWNNSLVVYVLNKYDPVCAACKCKQTISYGSLSNTDVCFVQYTINTLSKMHDKLQPQLFIDRTEQMATTADDPNSQNMQFLEDNLSTQYHIYR